MKRRNYNTNDDDEGEMLPVAFPIGDGDVTDGPPTSGEEYLRQVRYELTFANLMDI